MWTNCSIAVYCTSDLCKMGMNLILINHVISH
uniref:Uncharacterized protein n=1 Tax=Anguilla anguilla TaxID=7936 RepID=A0A0E9V649_ANGAN